MEVRLCVDNLYYLFTFMCWLYSALVERSAAFSPFTPLMAGASTPSVSSNAIGREV